MSRPTMLNPTPLSAMMTTPLTITSIMRHCEKVNGHGQVVSVTADQPRHRYTYRDAFARTRQLANALQRLGLQAGDTLTTFAWNDHRHLEIYYGVACSGMICHTVNPRLFPAQQEYIVNHGRGRWVFVDATLITLLENLQHTLTGVEGFIILTDAAHMPVTSLHNALCYETLLGAESDTFDWPELDENTPSALCYTSGTTGDPKGVLYTHRSTVLHSMASIAPDQFNLSQHDSVLPIVPMFHVNGWGLVYSAPMVGAKLVLPGPKMADGETLCALINEEGVTASAGVPTVWLALLDYLQSHGKTVPGLERIVVGGAACPFVVFNEFRRLGVAVHMGWGMTETSPLGSYNGRLPAALDEQSDTALNQKARDQQALKAGRPLFGVEMKITGEDGSELPWDGKSCGAVKVRGPWVVQQYLHSDSPATDAEGWFETGDVGCIDSLGYLQITDRLKDVIKSGGEWISSIALENAAVNHPAVAEAAVVGLPHPKWTERPLLLVVLKPGADLDRDTLLHWLADKVAKWWLPDDCVFVDELPHTATGKLSKKDLRQRFRDHAWPQ